MTAATTVPSLSAADRQRYWRHWDAMFGNSLAPDARTACKFIEQEEETELARDDVREVWIEFCKSKGLRVGQEMDERGNVYELQWSTATGSSYVDSPAAEAQPFEYAEHLQDTGFEEDNGTSRVNSGPN